MKPKLKYTFTEIVIMALIGCVIISVGAYLGYWVWNNNMAMSISEDAEYYIGTADLTSEILYQTVSNSFMLAFIFTALGAIAGFAVDTALAVIYLMIKIIILVIKRAHFNKKNKSNDREETESEKTKKNNKENKKGEKKHGKNSKTGRSKMARK